MFGHGDVMATDCPGTNLRARIQQLRDESTARIGTRTPLYNLWLSTGGDTGTLGAVYELEHPLAGGSVVTFANGTGYQRPDGQVFWLGRALDALYQSLGGPTGSYGWPTSSQVTVSPGDNRATFEHGSIPYQPDTTTFAATSRFVPMSPVRLLDTRLTKSVPGKTTITLQVAGVAGVPADAAAVSLNVTVTDTRVGGFITVWPTGGPLPNVSNLNFFADQTVPNLVTVKAGTSGTVSIYNASTAAVSLVVDLGGYYVSGAPTAGGGMVSVTPKRLLDTRIGLGGPQAIAAGADLGLKVTGGAVPTDAVAVLLNVTVSSPSSPGWIEAYPAGVPAPTASNVNFDKNRDSANLALVKVGAGGVVNLRNGASTPTQVVADVMGYISGTGTAGGYLAADQPVRILDSRIGNGYVGPVRSNTAVTLQITGRAGVPSSGVTAVVLNLTVTECQTGGYITVYRTGVSDPGTSNLNYVGGSTVANMVVVAVGADGAIVLHNASIGSTQIIADIEGYVV